VILAKRVKDPSVGTAQSRVAQDGLGVGVNANIDDKALTQLFIVPRIIGPKDSGITTVFTAVMTSSVILCCTTIIAINSLDSVITASNIAVGTDIITGQLFFFLDMSTMEL